MFHSLVRRSLGASEIEHRRPENRPVAMEFPTPGDADFLLVAQILDRGVDIAIEAQIVDPGIGFGGADGQVELVAADRQIVLVQPEAVGEIDEPSELEAGAADDVVVSSHIEIVEFGVPNQIPESIGAPQCELSLCIKTYRV